MKFLFVEIFVDWALACLRHSMCLGGWAAPLPRAPPIAIADITPGSNGILWSADGAPTPVTAPEAGSAPAEVPPETFAWARVGWITGAAADQAMQRSGGSDHSSTAGNSAKAVGLTHNFRPNPKAERVGLTSEDYGHYMSMLPPNLKLRQRKRLKLIQNLKEVAMRGGDPLALVRQMFPHGGEREIEEAGRKQLPSSMTGGGALATGARGDDDDDDGDD